MKFAAMMATDFGRGLGLDAGVHENTALDKLAKKKNVKSSSFPVWEMPGSLPPL